MIAPLKATNVYDQFIEYLAQHVSPDEILAFKASDKEQARLEELTEKNKAGTLTTDEATELEQMLDFNRLMTLLKTRAYVALKQK